MTSLAEKQRNINARITDGMISHLRSGAHIRYDDRTNNYTMVHGLKSFRVSAAEFEDLQYRYAITYTFDQNFYARGGIWVFNGPCPIGGA